MHHILYLPSDSFPTMIIEENDDGTLYRENDYIKRSLFRLLFIIKTENVYLVTFSVQSTIIIFFNDHGILFTSRKGIQVYFIKLN